MKTPTKFLSMIGRKGGSSKSIKKASSAAINLIKAREKRWPKKDKIIS